MGLSGLALGAADIWNRSARACADTSATSRPTSRIAGSDGGARHGAIAKTLIQTAKRNGIEPMAWLTDVLQSIVSGRTKAHELYTLLPRNWTPGPEDNGVVALAA